MYGEKVKKIAALQPLFTLDKFIIPTTKQGDQQCRTNMKYAEQERQSSTRFIMQSEPTQRKGAEDRRKTRPVKHRRR